MGKIDLQVHIVPDVFYACCILHNMTIKRGGMPLEELLCRMTLEAKNEVRLHDQGCWADAAELEHQHAIRLQQGEIGGDEQWMNLVYYLAVQPQRAWIEPFMHWKMGKLYIQVNIVTDLLPCTFCQLSHFILAFT